ncbi:hypothetical protein B0H10DRAFT_2073826 [Mycena sp. CBHHK59/15]|nr:hypothetical protein B0H10DRAFT_2073826 [Mycena sp. CBHHK59/15]
MDTGGHNSLGGNYHPLFNDENADIILQSLEGTLYRTHSFTLRTTSGFFRTMLSLPQSKEMESDGAPIAVFEHDAPLEGILRMMCGLEVPKWHSFDEVEAVLSLIEKFDAPGPNSVVRSAVHSPMFVAEPLRLYALATHFEWADVTNMALMETLKLDLLSEQNRQNLRRLSSQSLLVLLDFHETCKNHLKATLDNPVFFSAGNNDPRTCSCSRSIDNYKWRTLKSKIISEFSRRPLGDNVIAEVEVWPESLACWDAICRCGILYYQRIPTIRNIKIAVESAVENAQSSLTSSDS